MTNQQDIATTIADRAVRKHAADALRSCLANLRPDWRAEVERIAQRCEDEGGLEAVELATAVCHRYTAITRHVASTIGAAHSCLLDAEQDPDSVPYLAEAAAAWQPLRRDRQAARAAEVDWQERLRGGV